tara:strand:- start:3075 stop:3920 length:846 start_codon:yes stop_codon:yes gene_type:complete
MKCSECQANNNRYDERLGETICVECGLVLVLTPFEHGTYSHDSNGNLLREQWSDNLHKLGLQTIKPSTMSFRAVENTAIYRGVAMCKLLMSSLKLPKYIFNQVEELYIRLYRKNIFTTTPLEDRAAALVYYCLRRENLPFTLNEICREYSCTPKSVFPLARKVAKAEGKTSVFLIKECRPFAEKYAMALGSSSYVGKVSRLSTYFDSLISLANENTRPSTSAAYCSIVSTMENMSLTNKEIGEVCGVGFNAIGKEVKRLLKLKNTNKKQIKGKGIEWLERF